MVGLWSVLRVQRDLGIHLKVAQVDGIVKEVFGTLACIVKGTEYKNGNFMLLMYKTLMI